MAKLIDLPEEPTEAPGEDVQPTPLEPTQATHEDVGKDAEHPSAPQAPVEDIPEKYRGKSPQELIRMHQEAEKRMGKQGSEVGELRKIVDEYIVNQAATKAPPTEPTETTEVDWFEDPDAALNAKLDAHPTIQKMEAEAVKNARDANKSALETKHPDHQEIMQDGEFADWIRSSKVRTRLFIEADQNFDIDAADELFSTWKERKNFATATAQADKQARKEELRQAATGDTRGSSAPTPKKIYRRSDVINLMTKDPDRYQQLAPEILLAYKEGRVR